MSKGIDQSIDEIRERLATIEGMVSLQKDRQKMFGYPDECFQIGLNPREMTFLLDLAKQIATTPPNQNKKKPSLWEKVKNLFS
jgi:hypothetical protein